MPARAAARPAADARLWYAPQGARSAGPGACSARHHDPRPRPRRRRPGPPPWPAEPLTVSETRVLRYLPTHLGAPEIAAELFLSANTVKTHLRHLYRKLGAHSRREAVQRARAIGLLTAPARRP